MRFTESDLTQIRAHGLDADAVTGQLARFASGFSPLHLDRACTPGDGITRISDGEATALIAASDTAAAAGRVAKFVPASGAASRMFKDLMAIAADPEGDARIADTADTGAAAARVFLARLDDFAFIGALGEVLAARGEDLGTLRAAGGGCRIITAALGPDGLDMARLPKGLLAFHQHADCPHTAAADHLAEAAAFVHGGGSIDVHFTVSDVHQELFEAECAAAVSTHADTRLSVSFSQQQPATDTIAAAADNTPFRDDDGRLVFRPGGHGALLSNLQALGGDIVFLKNVDNILPASANAEAVRQMKILCGRVVMTQQALFPLLQRLTADGAAADDALHAAATAQCASLGIATAAAPAADDADWPAWFVAQLNRPIRVCGMVRNEGEPGGGPFWVRHQQGACSPQIVESSQVALDDPAAAATWQSSTHFNPVLLACGVRDFRGGAFALADYCDPETGFVAEKSMAGRPLRALELPGLWNGAMAHWLTQFVDVPISVFNPVKTVLDLLRPGHQA
jgi:hypothetical protein